MKRWMFKAVLPLAGSILLAFLLCPLCLQDGHCDYMKLWLLMGIPFGIHKMFLVFVPRGLDIGGTVGVFALNILAGGALGGFVLIYRLILAAGYFVGVPVRKIACFIWNRGR